VAKVRIEAPVKGESHRKTATPRTYSRARLSLTLLTKKELLYDCLRAGGISIPDSTEIDGRRR
ncbi:MAG: hypothetical protein OXD29_09730, partial [Roseovarius sp.]|nr:hypothetical protein [Roseovarius sp.]